MPRYIAFLRAINVGGRVVKMDALRMHFVALGLVDVESFIASGNVVFVSDLRADELEPRIEAALLAPLGYGVDAFLRSDAEVGAVAAAAPFGDVQPGEGDSHYVIFLRSRPSPSVVAAVAALSRETDLFAIDARELHWLRRGGNLAGTTVREVDIARALGPLAIGTMRNIKTVRRLAAKYPPTW